MALSVFCVPCLWHFVAGICESLLFQPCFIPSFSPLHKDVHISNRQRSSITSALSCSEQGASCIIVPAEENVGPTNNSKLCYEHKRHTQVH